MMMTNLIRTVLILLLLPGTYLKAQTELGMNLDFSKATPLQRDAYGINNEFIHPPYTPAFKNFKDVYTDLGKPTFRYPAGTGANYINLATGFATGWEGMDEGTKKRMDGFNAALKHSGKGETGIEVQDFIRFMKETKPVCNYVLNVSSASIADNKKVLTKIKNSGVELTHFELGNELYYPAYKSAFPNVSAYIIKAKAMSTMVRDIFPNAKIAVGVPIEYFTKEIFLEGPIEKGNRMEQWYRRMQNESFYDAISVHLYANVGMDGKTEKEDFLSFKEAYEFAISHTDSRIAYTFDRMKADFPSKEIWLTEYHVGGFVGELRQYRLRYTFLGGLYCADFLLKTFANPQVTLSNWHSMVQFLKYDKPERNSLIDQNAPFGFKTNYYFFKLFKEPVLNSTQYVPVELSNVVKYEGVGTFRGTFNEVDAGVFYNDKTGIGYLVLLNKKSTNYSVSVDRLEKALKGKIQKGTVLSPNSNQSLDKALASEEARNISDIVMHKGMLEVKPYSVYVIKFKN